MKRKNTDIEFYRDTIDRLQQEKAAYAEENRAQRQEIASLHEELRSLRDEIKAMNAMLESYLEENKKLHLTIETLSLTLKDVNTAHTKTTAQLADALSKEKLARGKRFAPTTEQSNLLNNRRTDERGEEKDNFDGTPPPPASSSNTDDPVQSKSKRRKKKSEGRKPAKEDYKCERTIYHGLGSYFNLPEGGQFKTVDGRVDIHHYEVYNYIPGYVEKHVYETATYIDAEGEAHNTLSRELRSNPVAGCPFSAEMLALILVEKYAYHTPKNRIKQKLRDMGACFSKSTFSRYHQLAEKALRDMLEDSFQKAVVDCMYLMIDETCELVGVVDEQTHIPEYKKKYLWAIYNKAAGLVRYIYEKGSRGKDVIKKVLELFKGSFTSDGYVVYKIFDDKGLYPELLHCGCWAHVRRYFIEAIGVASDICHMFIDHIELLFLNERSFKHLAPEERAAKRKRHSLPILNTIFAMAERISKDAELMGRELLKKAVSYVNNQVETLRNFILDGNAEISNNLCEQRMKPIKLSIKNCQNIGSEKAAENAAFMHSLVESCRINGKGPYEYLCSLFKKIRTAIDDVGKRALLPDRWVPDS